MTKVISISEVNKHNNKNSVWFVIDNDVYDVTNYLAEHPGGEETLLDHAGKDATQPFEDIGHSEDARELLKKFKIGTLPEDERDMQPAPTAATTLTWKARPKDQRVRIESPVSNTRVVPSGGSWKWYALALLGAIAIGVLVKKKMAA